MINSLLTKIFERTVPPVSPEDVRAEVEARHRSINRNTASTLTRGNVSIQSGHFVTRADIDSELNLEPGRN